MVFGDTRQQIFDLPRLDSTETGIMNHPLDLIDAGTLNGVPCGKGTSQFPIGCFVVAPASPR